MDDSIKIAGQEIPPGKRRWIEIPVAHLPMQTSLSSSLPVVVINGKAPGPKLFISAAIHGDELNGVEIIHQVLENITAKKLRGCIIAVPVVNLFGFIQQSRYLPDRRDLNRCFPGSPRGSLAARLAHLFMKEVVLKCSHGIDLHTAAAPRTNLPQIRANLKDSETYEFARAFAAPVMLHSSTRDGSLRQAAMHKGVKVLLYEAGEPLRFNEEAIATGVAGIFRTLAFLEMYKESPATPPESIEITESKWIRAHHSGILLLQVKLGETVRKKQNLGHVSDIFRKKNSILHAPFDGIVIGYTQNPLVYQGDAVVHLAKLPGDTP